MRAYLFIVIPSAARNLLFVGSAEYGCPTLGAAARSGIMTADGRILNNLSSRPERSEASAVEGPALLEALTVLRISRSKPGSGPSKAPAAQRRHKKARHGSAGKADVEPIQSALADDTSFATASILSDVRTREHRVTRISPQHCGANEETL